MLFYTYTVTEDSRRGWGDWTGEGQAISWLTVTQAAAIASIDRGADLYSEGWNSVRSSNPQG